MPQIDLKVLTRPKQTRAYVATFPDVIGYQHVKTAQGGDDSATCQIHLPYGQAAHFINEYLGNRVEFYVNNPEAPIAEGYIHRISMESGALMQTRSFDSMFNRTVITYDLNGAGTQQETVVNNTTSQDKYGVKLGSMDGGVNYHSSNVSHKRALRQLLNNIQSWPGVSTVYSGRPGNTGVISIEVKGIQYFAFDWVDYNEAVSTIQSNVSIIITGTLLPYASNTNAPLVVSTSDVSLITTNSSFNYAVKNLSGQSIWQQFLSIIEAGDESTRWVIGVTPYDRRLGYHRLYYRPARTTVNYLMHTSRDYQVFDITGRRVQPWEMQADYGLRIVDGDAPPTLLPVNVGQGDNPNVLYVKTVRYDADSNTATWQSDDDLTTEGALQLGKVHKIINQKGGSPSLRTRL